MSDMIQPEAHSSALLQVKNLKVSFVTRRGPLTALEDISFDIAPGEILGMVGESGAGKSLTGHTVMGLLPPGCQVDAGEIVFDNRRIDNLCEEERRRIRGKDIGMIFQDPLTSLDPLFTIGDHLIETICEHLPFSKEQARERALKLLEETGIPSPDKRLDQYPHQLSGGMRQRVVIALALAASPRLIIADEPTTALDVSIQAQIIVSLKRLCSEEKTAILLVTHDMGVIAEAADRVAVMYAGKIIEIGPVKNVIQAPQHPYTQGLMGAIPTLDLHNEWLSQIDGTMPGLSQRAQGCAFHPRCAAAIDICKTGPAPRLTASSGSCVACHLVASGNQKRLSHVREHQRFKPLGLREL